MEIFDHVLAKISELDSDYATKLVAIDGRGGSGKSSFTKALVSINPEYQIIQIDHFPCTAEDYAFHDSGTQTRIDTSRIINEAIEPLLAGDIARYSTTCWWGSNKQQNALSVKPEGVVLLEGCYALLPILRKYYSYSIWIDCAASVALKRAIKRDGEESREAWENAYYLNEESYIKKFNPKESANLIVENNGESFKAVI